eukprot:m51a1_g11544 putative autophagyrelated protein (123) ;mRNA; r:9331-9870
METPPQPQSQTQSPAHERKASSAAEGEAAGAAAAGKVLVLFKAVGDAPALKLKKFQVNADAPVLVLVEFLRRQLKAAASDPLFVFINSAFQPALDQRLGDIAKCFAVGGKVIVHYSTTVAWG